MSSKKSKSFAGTSFYVDMAQLLSEIKSLAIAHGCMLDNDIPEVEAAPIMDILLSRISAAHELLERWHKHTEAPPSSQ